jgi:hypothetical protein
MLIVAGGLTRLVQKLTLPMCAPGEGRFQHLNCIKPSPELWPQVVVGLAVAVATWVIAGRMRSRD